MTIQALEATISSSGRAQSQRRRSSIRRNTQSAFKDLQDGKLYYWRVEAFRKDGTKIGLPGVNQVWEMRYDQSLSELTTSSVSSPTHPRNGYQAVGTPPVLGWLPVVANGQSAANYHIQISPEPRLYSHCRRGISRSSSTMCLGKDAIALCPPLPIGGVCGRRQARGAS